MKVENFAVQRKKILRFRFLMDNNNWLIDWLVAGSIDWLIDRLLGLIDWLIDWSPPLIDWLIDRSPELIDWLKVFAWFFSDT